SSRLSCQRTRTRTASRSTSGHCSPSSSLWRIPVARASAYSAWSRSPCDTSRRHRASSAESGWISDSAQAELAGLATGDGAERPVEDRPRAIAPGGDVEEVVAVPDQPRWEADEDKRADAGDAGAPAQEREVATRRKAERRRLPPVEVGCDAARDVRAHVLGG